VQWDKDQLARTFMEVYKVTYAVGRDVSGTIGTLYAIEATPTSVFIDKVGRLVERHEGGLEEAEFVKRVEPLLK
jgi:hypothetical protein